MQVTLPEMGESVTEGTVAKWLKQPGDSVREGEALVAVEVRAREAGAGIGGVLDRELAALEEPGLTAGREVDHAGRLVGELAGHPARPEVWRLVDVLVAVEDRAIGSPGHREIGA